jgi:hypothetical protein
MLRGSPTSLPAADLDRRAAGGLGAVASGAGGLPGRLR